MAFPEYVGSVDDRVQPASRRKEFLRGPRSFMEGGGGEKRERDRESRSINIRRGKLQAETLMDPARAVLRPLMVGGDGDGDADVDADADGSGAVWYSGGWWRWWRW